MVLTGNPDNMCCKLTSDSASIASSAALKQTKKQTLPKKHMGHYTVLNETDADEKPSAQ